MDDVLREALDGLVAVAAVPVVVVLIAAGSGDLARSALVGAAMLGGPLLLTHLVSPTGMGFGDVRLAAPVGLVLGWVGWGALAVGVWIGFIVFALPALVLVVARRDRAMLKKSFPFGPFMVIGALVGLVWGTALAGRIWG